jgi:two-component system response regulator NreC
MISTRPQADSAPVTPVTAPPRIRVAIADDHAVVRRGLRHMLEECDGIDVVGEAADLDGARAHLQNTRPEVLILDLNFPGGSSIPAIPQMRSRWPATQIVVLTMHHEPAYARQALTAGALGFVLKDSDETELVEAVRRAASGDTYLDARLGARLAAEPARKSPGGLSAREIDVLRLIALGYTNGEIARELRLSLRTVETHRAHVQHKLHLSARSDLVRFALEHHVLDI